MLKVIQNLITALIVQGLLMDPSTDLKKMETIYDGLMKLLKKIQNQVAVKARLAEIKSAYSCPALYHW
jgi:hypothetical protein